MRVDNSIDLIIESENFDFDVDIQMKSRQRYWLMTFDRYKKNLIDLFKSIDLIETIKLLHCVRFEIRIAIDIDVVEIDIDVVVVVYNLDIVETIDIEFDFVVLTYHDEF